MAKPVKMKDFLLSERLETIFNEVCREFGRQDEEWGERNRPVTRSKSGHALYRMLADKREADIVAESEQGSVVSWDSILLEEVYGAFAETESGKQREEMIRVIAVAAAIIECLDRQDRDKRRPAYD